MERQTFAPPLNLTRKLQSFSTLDLSSFALGHNDDTQVSKLLKRKTPLYEEQRLRGLFKRKHFADARNWQRNQVGGPSLNVLIFRLKDPPAFHQLVFAHAVVWRQKPGRKLWVTQIYKRLVVSPIDVPSAMGEQIVNHIHEEFLNSAERGFVPVDASLKVFPRGFWKESGLAAEQ